MVCLPSSTSPPEDLVHSLEITRDILQQTLPPALGTFASAYLSAGLAQLETLPVTAPTFIDDRQPLAPLARQYMDALLAGQRHTASELVTAAVQRGVSVKDVYLDIFQATQYEIGRLWQTNQVNVAQEHYCTAATQLIMSQLYPLIFATEKNGHRLVAACVGRELHEIGVRIVTDFLEMDGWDTYYLGANVPVASIVQAIVDRKAHVLALSATMTFHIDTMTEVIRQVRQSAVGPELKIMVGGYPFNIAPDLWRQVGADGYARNGNEAVQLANRLITAEA